MSAGWNQSDPDTPSDWLDDLLRDSINDLDQNNDQFVQAVMNMLPRATARRTRIFAQWVNAGALITSSVLLAYLLPAAVDVFADRNAGELISRETIEHWPLVIALLAWMSWWLMKPPFFDELPIAKPY